MSGAYTRTCQSHLCPAGRTNLPLANVTFLIWKWRRVTPSGSSKPARQKLEILREYQFIIVVVS